MNIQTITLSDIIVSGRHGAGALEKDEPQPFSVGVSLSLDASAAIAAESLEKTIDYYDVVSAIRSVIENQQQPCVLLETLTARIVDELSAVFPAVSIEVSVQKIHAASRPKISTARHYYSARAVAGMKSFEELHSDIITIGIASTPFLSESERQTLLALAETQEFVRHPQEAHESQVREDLSFCMMTHESGVFRVVADRVANFLQEMQRTIGATLFDQSLTHKEPSLQKYDAGSFGITPHRDEKKFHGVVCIIPLKGTGTLAVCDDREGSNPLRVDTTPGNLILLRAPGYMGMSVRPLHFVSDITEERIVLGIRFPRTLSS